MVPRVNLLPRAIRNLAGPRHTTKQRVYLAILILSGLVGAGAAVELLVAPKLKAPE